MARSDLPLWHVWTLGGSRLTVRAATALAAQVAVERMGLAVDRVEAGA